MTWKPLKGEERARKLEELKREFPEQADLLDKWEREEGPPAPPMTAKELQNILRKGCKRQVKVEDWASLANPACRDILESNISPTEKIVRLVDMWLKENPDFEPVEEELQHPSYFILHRLIKPWLYAQCDEEFDLVKLWTLLLAAAKEWFPERSETKLGHIFCVRFELEECTWWNGWEAIQPVLQEYLVWRYGEDYLTEWGRESEDITKQKALRAYAKMMNTLQTEWLAPVLAEDLRYNSQWVFEEMRGKQKYLDYMQGKLRTIAESGRRPYAEIGELQEYPYGECVILAQDDIDNLIATVHVGIEGGLIAKLDICAVPAPQSARRTGEYPGRN